MTRLSKIAFTAAFLVAIIVVLAVQRAEAHSSTVTSSLSGTGFSVPIDLDGNGTSCTTVGSVTTCPDDSVASTYVGQSNGEFGGRFNGQNVAETVPVSGTGCLFAPTTIQSCTLGAVTNACEFQYVAGGSGASVHLATGSVESYTITGGTVCLDVSSGLPLTLPAHKHSRSREETGNSKA